MNRLPKLDERLDALAELVRPGFRCADVGCDHGYLIAWLCASGRIPGGYACDINRKPLEKAAFTLSEYGVADRVKPVLCNGLAGLEAGCAEEIVIAGMGGDLIWEIISACPWSRDPALRFILQPMTKAARLRRDLYENGFCILREKAVLSGGFPYAVMQVAYTGERRSLAPAFAWGGLLLSDGSEPARRYLEKAAKQVRERVEGLEKAEDPEPELTEARMLLKELESRCNE